MVGDETGCEDQRDDQFHQGGGHDDRRDQRSDLPQSARRHPRLCEEPRADAELSGDRQGQQRRNRHDPQATDLDAREDHHLTRRGPVRRGVHRRQAGH